MTEAMQGNWVYGRANSVTNSSFGTKVRPYYIENIQECNTTSILRYGQPTIVNDLPREWEKNYIKRQCV